MDVSLVHQHHRAFGFFGQEALDVECEVMVPVGLFGVHT